MSDTFLSYASADRERVVPLVNALESQGLDVWWDRDIAHGDNYHRVIEKALQEAGCAIVVWSVNSVGSEWVVNEASAARRRGVLVPALLDEVDPPLEFRHLQAELKKLFNAAKGVINRSGNPSQKRAAGQGSQLTAQKSWWKTPAGWAAGAGVLLIGIAFLVTALRLGTGSEAEAPSGTVGPSSPSAAVPEATGTTSASLKGKTNLLDAAEGAKIVAASESNWKDYIFGEHRPSCSIVAAGGFVTFAFRDERRARVDGLGVFIEATDTYNAKTVEVYASDTSDQGPFMKVGTFEVPNFRNERQPYHEFSFEPVTARYVKLVVPEFRWGSNMPNGNICTMELHGTVL